MHAKAWPVLTMVAFACVAGALWLQLRPEPLAPAPAPATLAQQPAPMEFVEPEVAKVQSLHASREAKQDLLIWLNLDKRIYQRLFNTVVRNGAVSPRGDLLLSTLELGMADSDQQVEARIREFKRGNLSWAQRLAVLHPIDRNNFSYMFRIDPTIYPDLYKRGVFRKGFTATARAEMRSAIDRAQSRKSPR